MKHSNLTLFALGTIVLFAMGCAPSPNAMEDVVNPINRELAGFWLGLWHGTISPFIFVVSWFTDSVNVYEVHNNGGWYNFGFLFGVGAFAKGGQQVTK